MAAPSRSTLRGEWYRSSRYSDSSRGEPEPEKIVGGLLWVKSGKSQSEQKFSALHQKAVTYARASSTGGGKAGGVVVSLRKGEEIVFGPDGSLERDTGKD
jgi:hypothetical protein